MMERTVTIRLQDEFLKTLEENGVGMIDRRVSDAIGYLSMWGLGGRFKGVTIFGDARGELIATYQEANGATGYTIGAVPDDNWNYSFHS